MSRTAEDITYEEAKNELASILERLESGETNVDQLHTLVARAKHLVTFCQLKLREIEQALDASNNDVSPN
ncbi:MAG: exodeoxyribonuclease VII small subunit [Saprospiraceae bacterium]|nr:exodeoxyribonuclease VII small subunit [Saprospiraceae bacterium]